MPAAADATMAPPTPNDEEQFRLDIRIMPPRRPTNSLFRRLKQPKVEEPLFTMAVPARASETFADVWNAIRERYERNYGAEEVAKGWFHKLQDRFGADIDTHDGVGALGYTARATQEERTLVMLQNAIDRDGSVPETSGLRPAGFSRPQLTAEQEHQAKRRRVEEERYGATLEELDEDTPVQSREESSGLRSSQLGEDNDGSRKVDADGFAVPALPGSLSRKRKRLSMNRDDVIQSSMEGENEEDILVPGSQPVGDDEETVPGSFQTDSAASRAQLRQSMPADAAAGASSSNAKATRALTAAPEVASRHSTKNGSEGSLQLQKSSALEGTSGLNSRVQARSPPTPVSGKSQLLTQQPPESAQRPRPTPLVASTPANHPTQHQQSRPHESLQDIDNYDPIEDDELLQGIAGTGTTANDIDDDEPVAAMQDKTPAYSRAKASTSTKRKAGKLSKPSNMITSTPRHNALEILSSGTQGSTSKNPRTRSSGKDFWTQGQDSFLLQGYRQGLGAAEILKRYGIADRSTSAVRSRLRLLLEKRPEISSQKGVEENLSDDDRHGPSSSKKRQPWPSGDVQIISRAIADGFDALEIHAMKFPKRSEDAVNRKVIAIQDQVWKNASKDPLFPENNAQLDGWTLKDGCKLRRTFQEGLPTKEAKDRFFGRWTMNQVQKQLDGYKAQIQAIKACQGRAAQAAKAANELALESSQLPANSSPVERSIQARAARHPSDEAQQNRPIEVPSSPPQASASQRKSQAQSRSTVPAKRHSSPTVEVPTLEQNRARTSLSRPPSGSWGQTKLNFTREKGKSRAGAPRPSDEELDAQYSRRHTSTALSAQRSESDIAASTVQKDHGSADGDNTEHTPADDLEMLDAELDKEDGTTTRKGKGAVVGGDRPYSSGTRQTPTADFEPRRSPRTLDSMQADLNNASGNASLKAITAITSSLSPASAERRKTGSSPRSLLSPMMTGNGATSASSDRRRQSRVESGVDTRAAVQLSQELQRSLSREGREESQQESQAFQTQDPATSRSQRAAATAIAAPVNPEPDDNLDEYESQAFQTQDPGATRSQRAAKIGQIENTRLTSANSRESSALQPSPQIGTANANGTPVATPATTPTTGKLPSRGQSYASKIRDIHRPTQGAAAVAARRSADSETSHPTNDNSKSSTGKDLLPPPTDAELWERTVHAEALGKDRQEYFEDLKISAFSIRAMAREDWDEVERLKAEHRRLKRQRKIAKGEYIPSARDAAHPDGPAEGGDDGQADEDVTRVDDVTSSESEYDDDAEGNVWSDGDFDQPVEMDRDRHFSEVDDDEAEDLTTKASGQADAPLEVEHDRYFSEVEEHKEPTEAIDTTEDPQSKRDTDAVVEEEDEEELELPTIASVMEPNGEVHDALTDENLQELNNSGAEGSPVRISKKPQASGSHTTPGAKAQERQTNDNATMPPPSTTLQASKRKQRRKRHRRRSTSASEHSSLFSHAVLSSDAPRPQIPSTPAQKETPGRPSKKPKLSESTPVSQTPKSSRQTQTQPTTHSSQAATMSLVGGSQQRSAGGGSMGLSGLVRKAHIPSPPKAKPAPQKSTKSNNFAIQADDDESEKSSSDSD